MIFDSSATSETNKKEIAVLVNSCDFYEEAWPYFFNLYFKYFAVCNPFLTFSTYLNTENLSYGDDRVIVLNSKSVAWSSRLIDSLNKITQDYVVLLLDDFFIMKSVDLAELSRIYDIMKSNQIDAFYFKHITGQESNCVYFNRYVKMNPNKKYFMSFQACIWKKNSLINVLKEGLNPWEIEEQNMINHQNELTMFCDYKSDYNDCSNDVIPYLWALESGYGICKSKWLWNNKMLFKKNGMRFKRKKLGYLSKNNYFWSKILKHLKKV